MVFILSPNKKIAESALLPYHRLILLNNVYKVFQISKREKIGPLKLSSKVFKVNLAVEIACNRLNIDPPH